VNITIHIRRFASRASVWQVRFSLLSTLLALAWCAPGATAQMVGGTIAGDVVDPAGAAVGRAEVVIRNEETGGERRFVTADSGTFSALSIPVGMYTVSVSRDGFAPLDRTGVALTVGQSIHLHLALTLGSVQQSVSVVDTPATVDTSTLQTQGLVDERQVKELPLNGRSFDQLIQLNPASVSYTTQRSGGVGTSNSSVGNMYSVSGRRPQDNLFLLNGIEYTGASLINVTPGGTNSTWSAIRMARITASARERRYRLSPRQEETHSTAPSMSSCATAHWTRVITSTRRRFRRFSAIISAPPSADLCAMTSSSALVTTKVIDSIWV
jgi:hypothetical protein